MLTDIYTFGDDLIRSQDLDPVYCALYGAQLFEPQLSRLLLAYLAFYHLGFAAWLSEHEGDGYWTAAVRQALAAGQRAPAFSRFEMRQRSGLAAKQISDPRSTDTFVAQW
jgi:hypothetical protein